MCRVNGIFRELQVAWGASVRGRCGAVGGRASRTVCPGKEFGLYPEVCGEPSR